MNTCLSNVYLKFYMFDSRYIRLAILVLALVAGGHHVITSVPISGDCGI